MRWSEFQDTATRLLQGTTEGDWRSAISRSYYGVFHYLRELLLSHGVDIGQSGQSHFNLYSGLLHYGFRPVAQIASRLDDLRLNRVRADYQLGQVIVQSFAVTMVQEAQHMSADFQAVLASVAPAQIANGVRLHLLAIGRLKPSP